MTVNHTEDTTNWLNTAQSIPNSLKDSLNSVFCTSKVTRASKSRTNSSSKFSIFAKIFILLILLSLENGVKASDSSSSDSDSDSDDDDHAKKHVKIHPEIKHESPSAKKKSLK